jgi:hypothetical protein
MPTQAKVKWIQFKDKAYDLKGHYHKVDFKYFFTNPIPWEIGESQETPVIDRLFTEWVGEAYVKTLYEIIAYCCYRAYPIQTLFCLYGSGRNGKSCFLRLLRKFLGDTNVCSTEFDKLMNNRFESFKLYKKLVCLMKDLVEKNAPPRVETVIVTTNNELSVYFMVGCGISVLLVGLALGAAIAVSSYPSTVDLKKSIEDKVVKPLSEAAHQTALDTSTQIGDTARIIIEETTALRKQGEAIQKDISHASDALARWTADVDERLEMLDRKNVSIINTNITSMHYFENERSNLNIGEREGFTINNTIISATSSALIRGNPSINPESNSLVPSNPNQFNSYWDTLDPDNF